MCLVWLIPITIIIVVIHAYTADKPKPKPIKIPHNWCAEIEYYDTVSHTLKQYYSQVKLNYDYEKLISITTINGDWIDSTQFLDDGMFDNNGDGSMANITLKDGRHFKITTLKMEQCGSKKKLDSLKLHINDEPDSPDPDDN